MKKFKDNNAHKTAVLVLTCGFTYSLFFYVLPQYRFLYDLSIETMVPVILLIYAAVFGILRKGLVNKRVTLLCYFLLLSVLLSQSLSVFSPTTLFYKLFGFIIGFFFLTHLFSYLSDKIKVVMYSHLALSFCLLIYGTYIYIVGDVPDTQTIEPGWKTIGRYWGFRYTVSTRNDDLFYIVPSFVMVTGFLIFSVLKKKYFLMALGGAYVAVIVLSLSRGHVLAAFVAVCMMVIMKEKTRSPGFISSLKVFRSMLLVVGFVVVSVYFVSFLVPEAPLLDIAKYKLMSYYDNSGQEEAFNMKSSNAARAGIYIIFADIIAHYPLGVGANNFQEASIALGHGRYWGESTYLEALGDYGVFGGWIFIWLMIYPIYKTWRRWNQDLSEISLIFFGLSLYIGVSALFNVLIGNLYFWLLYSMIYAHILVKPKLLLEGNR